MIDKPGIYFGIEAADYYADPMPTPSLTQSIAKVLIDRSPLHAWYCHPKLNPDYRADDSTKYDVGNVAHALLIGRGKSIFVLDHADWRTNAAKKERADAAELGKIGVLAKHYQLAQRMVAAAREQLDLRGLGFLFQERNGNGEVMLAWKEGGTWFRQLVDWLTADRLAFVDLKTTDMIAAPHCLSRMMVNAGWPIQAAMAERGLDALDPESAGRRRFLFIVQETEPPYCLNVVRMSEAAMTMGRKQLDHAVRIWRECISKDRWPGYPTEIVIPEFPSWAETQWLDREIAEDERRERIPSDILMAG